MACVVCLSVRLVEQLYLQLSCVVNCVSCACDGPGVPCHRLGAVVARVCRRSVVCVYILKKKAKNCIYSLTNVSVSK